MLEEGLIFEREVPGRSGVALPEEEGLEERVAAHLEGVALRREAPALPEAPESEVARHFTRLSQRNWGVDLGFYPLGSCTMKYNPKVHERLARLPGLAHLHPEQCAEQVQGLLAILWDLQGMLLEIGGMDAITLQPPAGAQGEFTALLCFRAHHRSRGEEGRTRILVPDSSHGTNPASAARCGMSVETIPSNDRGLIDQDALARSLDERVAGLMLTNPNTLGLFEEHAVEVCARVHEAGALVYCDGANMNAIAGIARPGDMGFDAMHFNTHKTLSTPHGGGGPGAGPVAVRALLEPYLPVPRIERDDLGAFRLGWEHPESVGMVHSHLGNVGVLLRAYAYLLSLGSRGLRETTERAVLNANYLLHLLRGRYEVAYETQPMHEFVLTASAQRRAGVRALDIAKRILDYGFHPPTVYFPLIVPEALMIEPTETETKATLDAFAAALLAIADECERSPELLREAPTRACCRRLDETAAARKPDVRYRRPPRGGGEVTSSGHAFAPTIARWRLIVSGPMAGPENMACDEALLDGVIAALAAGEDPVVTLRLYAWAPPAVSLGYHQDATRLDLARLEAEGVAVVRRATGGRAIYHADELTYAIAGPLTLFGRECSVMESYRALSGPILLGLREGLGVEAELASGRRSAHPTRARSVACFESPAQCDAVAGGRKVVGSAQVRRGGAFLQHGSLPLLPREERERAVLLGAGAARIEALGSLSEAAGREVGWPEAAEALVHGFEAAGVSFAGGELSDREREVTLSRLENVQVRSLSGAAIAAAHEGLSHGEPRESGARGPGGKGLP